MFLSAMNICSQILVIVFAQPFDPCIFGLFFFSIFQCILNLLSLSALFSPNANFAMPAAASTGAWSNTSPTPQASAWGAPSPTSQPSASGGLDAFGAPIGIPSTNGASSATSNPIDSEFDLLSARSTENSPTKSSSHGLEEFDLLAGTEVLGYSFMLAGIIVLCCWFF